MPKESWKSLEETGGISTGRGRGSDKRESKNPGKMKEPGGREPAGRDLRSLEVGRKIDFVGSLALHYKYNLLLAFL